jgi:hypothetical protein
VKIAIGLIGVVLSILIIVYRVSIRNFIGQIGWAERRLGPGGTYTALLLFGLLLFFFSLMIMTGTLDILFGGRGVEKFFDSAQ